jgi:hypothetical protein
MFWCLATLNMLDFWLTSMILKNGGYEMNPIPLWFIDQFGIVGILYLKIPFLLALGYAIYFKWGQLSPGFLKFAEPMVYLCVIVYSIVVAWSVGIYLYMMS